MKEDEVYGLPDWFLYMDFESYISLGLIVGFWIPDTIVPSALGIAFFMFFAIMMHLIKDPTIKSFCRYFFCFVSINSLIF